MPGKKIHIQNDLQYYDCETARFFGGPDTIITNIINQSRSIRAELGKYVSLCVNSNNAIHIMIGH